MATISQTFQPALPGLRAARARWTALHATWSRRRRIARELKAYTDRELADIGLTRADIPAVVRGSFRR